MASLKGVKLVVWDMDDTFWSGTLTEGGIVPRPEMHEMVAKLARCGVVSSICSNNDLEPVRDALRAQGVWDYFVFPAVSWATKPAMISALIKAMQLRPQNVLFVDDKPRIREQVYAAIPELIPPCDDRELLAAFRAELADTPDSDPSMERLEQYKLLERKAAARVAAGDEDSATPDAFLASCEVRCILISDLHGLEARLADLISRANQLNFTKRRRTQEEISDLLESDAFQCRAIRVVDKFGDYGICGFLAVRRADGVLTDFLFSCRVLEMGIEDAVYAWLRAPAIEGDDSEDARAASRRFLDHHKAAFWVQVLERDRDEPTLSAKPDVSGPPLRVLLAGGCDLVPIHAYLEARPPVPLELETQFTFANADGVRTTSFGAAALLRIASNPELRADKAELLARLPWFDPSAFESPLFSKSFDVYIGSAARDYFLANYRYRDGSFAVPFEYFRASLADFSRPENAERLRQASKRNSPALAEDFIPWFTSEFRFEGPLSPDEYLEHLTWLCSEVCPRSLVIMLNCTERELDWTRVPRDWGSLDDMFRHREHNRTMNRALERAREALDNLRIVDVNDYIDSVADAPDPLHFSRQVMFRITMEVNRMLTEHRAAGASAGLSR